MSRDKIAVIIPCYNEALTIGKVIDDFRRATVRPAAPESVAMKVRHHLNQAR